LTLKNGGVGREFFNGVHGDNLDLSFHQTESDKVVLVGRFQFSFFLSFFLSSPCFQTIKHILLRAINNYQSPLTT